MLGGSIQRLQTTGRPASRMIGPLVSAFDTDKLFCGLSLLERPAAERCCCRLTIRAVGQKAAKIGSVVSLRDFCAWHLIQNRNKHLRRSVNAYLSWTMTARLWMRCGTRCKRGFDVLVARDGNQGLALAEKETGSRHSGHDDAET